MGSSSFAALVTPSTPVSVVAAAIPGIGSTASTVPIVRARKWNKVPSHAGTNLGNEFRLSVLLLSGRDLGAFKVPTRGKGAQA
jgi:hypothetical protein